MEKIDPFQNLKSLKCSECGTKYDGYFGEPITCSRCQIIKNKKEGKPEQKFSWLEKLFLEK